MIDLTNVHHRVSVVSPMRCICFEQRGVAILYVLTPEAQAELRIKGAVVVPMYNPTHACTVAFIMESEL